ncbi:4787_t:CDS:2 [Entrophospora sp. SA101]|nr:4787_t:CDS:2 [Entrophospora sp. SA101]
MEEDEEDNLKHVCGEEIDKEEGNVGVEEMTFVSLLIFLLDDDEFLGFKNVHSIAFAFNNSSLPIHNPPET